jgi:hypothetical protein
MSEEPRWRRYGRLFGPDPRRDTGEEVRFHLEMRMRDYQRRGLGEAEARAAAAARLGDVVPGWQCLARISAGLPWEYGIRDWVSGIRISGLPVTPPRTTRIPGRSSSRRSAPA